MEEQIELLRIEFEKEYGMYWWINKTGTAERSLPYQEWLEKKAIQVQAKVIVKLADTCDWLFENDEMTMAYKTDCDNLFQFTNDGVKENHFKFCPYCGKPINEIIVNYERFDEEADEQAEGR
jgi:hypothetical protein